MRLFFALLPPAEVRARIEALQEGLDFAARREPAERFHLTVAFLGEVPERRLDRLRAAVSMPVPSMTLRFDRLGWFPRARVAWLGFGTPPSALVRFQAALAAELSASGQRLERRRWHPHLTLYRDMRMPPATMSLEPVEWQVDGLHLVESRLHETGPEYHSLAYWPGVDPADS